MSPTYTHIHHEILSHKNPAKAKVLQGFFKTGKGQYGEGDVFLGLTVPLSRSIAKKYVELPLGDVERLLASKFHEERLIALLILVEQFQSGDGKMQKLIVDFYLAHTDRINNWDLVDLTADKILGAYLESKSDAVLRRLAKSKQLWERRIAMIATFHDIKLGRPVRALLIAEMLLTDSHDLMHKAVGWMLREVGKRCGRTHLLAFLRRHAGTMPRTALRYALEHCSAEEREYFLGMKKMGRGE